MILCIFWVIAPENLNQCQNLGKKKSFWGQVPFLQAVHTLQYSNANTCVIITSFCQISVVSGNFSFICKLYFLFAANICKLSVQFSVFMPLNRRGGE